MYAAIAWILLCIGIILLGILVYELYLYIQNQKKQTKIFEKIERENRKIASELKEIKKKLENKSDNTNTDNLRD